MICARSPASTTPIHHRLDITGEVCPLTFVKAKLLLEAMAPGEIAEIRLQGAEPLANVPRALTEDGHEVLSLAAESDGGGPTGPHRLTVRKAGS